MHHQKEGIESRRFHEFEEELEAVTGEFDIVEAHAVETFDRMHKSKNPFKRFFAKFGYNEDLRRLAQLDEQSQLLEYRLNRLRVEE